MEIEEVIIETDIHEIKKVIIEAKEVIKIEFTLKLKNLIIIGDKKYDKIRATIQLNVEKNEDMKPFINARIANKNNVEAKIKSNIYFLLNNLIKGKSLKFSFKLQAIFAALFILLFLIFSLIADIFIILSISLSSKLQLS